MQHIFLTLLMLIALSLGSGFSCAAPFEAPDSARLDQDMAELQQLVNEKKNANALQKAARVRIKMEDEANPKRLEHFYFLMGRAAKANKEQARDIGGHFQSALLHVMAYGPTHIDTAIAEIRLANAYATYEIQVPLQLVLANALGTVGVLKRAGKYDSEVELTEAMAHALLGQSLVKAKRPEMAARHLKKALLLGRKGHLDAGNLQALENLLEHNAENMSVEVASKSVDEPCKAGAEFSEAQMQQCLRRADRLWAAENLDEAEAIYRDLTSDVKRLNLSEKRYEAARNLLILRLEKLPPDHPDVLTSVDSVAAYLAGEGDGGAASLITMRTAHALITHKKFNANIADLCGHIARRLSRANSEDVALRLLDAQAKLLVADFAKNTESTEPLSPERAARLRTHQLSLIEAANLAEANAYVAHAAQLRAPAVAFIDKLPIGAFETVDDDLSDFYSEQRGFLFPGPSAAIEYRARLAWRLPRDDPRRDMARRLWVSFISVYRGDDTAAMRLAEEFIAELRADPKGREEALAEMLNLHSGFVEAQNPEQSARDTREAHDIFARLPGMENKRIAMLLDMSSDQQKTGDTALAARLLDEADALRKTTPNPDLKMATLIDMKLAVRAFDNDETDKAIAIGEAAMRNLLASADKSTDPARYAKTLAGIYAAAGRMEGARQLYKTHVLVASANALTQGETKPLEDRLDLANLEAYYAPTPETIKELDDLLWLAQRRSKRADDLRRNILRAQSFARLGLGDGMASLRVGREAAALRPAHQSQIATRKEDRRLLETIVGAAYLAAVAAR